MKKLKTKKAFLFFYAFDIVLLLIVGLVFLPFSKGKNTSASISSAYLEDNGDGITEIKIIDRSKKSMVMMTCTEFGWIGTDSMSNQNLYWPVEEGRVLRFLDAMKRKRMWEKKAENTASWKKLSVDKENAIEVVFSNGSRTCGHVFFGFSDDLENTIYFRTSKNSTVWATNDEVSLYLSEIDPSIWADPYLVPLCARYVGSADKVSELRRGQLVFLKPAEHVKAFDSLDVEFDWGVKAHYDFYKKDDLVVVIPSFEGNDFLRNLSYRYSISQWTYEKFIKENKK